MVNARRSRSALMLCLVVVLAIGVAGCGTTVPTGSSGDGHTAAPETRPPTEIREDEALPPFSEERFVITGHADEVWLVLEIVKAVFREDWPQELWRYLLEMGSPAAAPGCPVDAIVEELDERGLLGSESEWVDLTKQATLNLEYLKEVVGTCEVLAPFKNASYATDLIDSLGRKPDDHWRMHWYSITAADHEFWEDDEAQDFLMEQSLVVYAVALINRLGHACSYPLSADLVNVTTGRLAARPWTGMGSPWTGMGSPWVDGLFEFSANSEDARDAFGTQWAFQQIGLTDGGSPDVVGFTGKGVRVGVFDTSPFEEGVETVDWMDPALELTVWKPDAWPGSSETSTLDALGLQPAWLLWASPDDEEIPPLDDHGLFAAGLVHAVARDSEIHLYEVLDEDGVGDLFVLNSALHSFIGDFVSDRQADPSSLSGAVINMSLGHPEELPEWLLTAIVAGADVSGQLAQMMPGGLPQGPMSLNTLLNAAGCHGIAVVSAAGNDRATIQTPASASSTVSVMASGDTGQRACFSSFGDIMAPGGDGKVVSGGDGEADAECAKPAFEQCVENWSQDCADARFGLIGPVLKSHSDSAGYAYAAGTSFSAPLVSGAAALALEKVGPWPYDLDEVYCRLGVGPECCEEEPCIVYLPRQ